MDLSSDEFLFLFAAAAFVAYAGVGYWIPLARLSWLGRSAARRLILMATPLAALVPTLVVLSRWADARVIGHGDYILLFMLASAAWLTIAARAMPWLGVSIRDDAVERDNPAAAWCAVGCLGGVGIACALCNVGQGPTIWTTVAPQAACTIILLALWLLIEWIGGGVAEAIAVDRDVACGLRLCGALLGAGLILGRAAGGDWISWRQTWVDLAQFGWPAIALALVAGVVQRSNRPKPPGPRPRIALAGVLPACLYLAGAIVAVALFPYPLQPSRW